MFRRVILLTSILMLSGCGYVARGAWEEIKILSRREPIETIVAEKKLEEKDRLKLSLVLDARKFAEKQGLNVGKSYSQYSEVDSSALVWVLTAAPHLKLEAKTWWFPFVGTVPYKGFFDKDEALSLKDKLVADGYDVAVRSSSAFSTLGWFNDPVLSTMLKGDEISLVDTIFHETLHRTIWVSGNVEFNESLANFIGGTFAEEFLREGNQIELADQAKARQDEEFSFGEFIAEVSSQLEALYQEERDKTYLITEKEKILEDARARWTARGPSLHYSLEKVPLNNASILSLRAYLKDLGSFRRLFELCDKDTSRFLDAVRKLSKASKNNPFDDLHELLKQPSACD